MAALKIKENRLYYRGRLFIPNLKKLTTVTNSNSLQLLVKRLFRQKRNL